MSAFGAPFSVGIQLQIKRKTKMNLYFSGLTSIAVDVTENNCDDAYAYINDLATEGMIVFSLKKKESFRINHSTFVHDESSLNFTVAGIKLEALSADYTSVGY